jgi:hypothetical protein
MAERGKCLFKTFLVGVEPEKKAKNKAVIRGRSNKLVDARNEHLLSRFVFWGMQHEYKYEWIIRKLCNEFYLSESTVGHIIENNPELLQKIRKAKSIRYWKLKYEFFKWDIK